VARALSEVTGGLPLHTIAPILGLDD